MALSEPNRDDFLGEAPVGMGERTFLGGFSLSARAWLYFFACSVAAAALIWAHIHAEAEINVAYERMHHAQRIDELVSGVERGTARVQSQLRQFLLTKDTAIAESFSADVFKVSNALDEVFSFKDMPQLAQQVSTLRDGLAQYDQQFQDFIAAEREIGASGDTGLSAELKKSSAALKQLFVTTNNANLVNQIDRINQQGEETLLSGYKKSVEEIQRRYRALEAFFGAAEIAAAERDTAKELLKAHETQMLSMINARFRLSGEARRFDELYEYIEPSLTAIAGVADRARVQTAADFRKSYLFARYTLAGTATAVVLWLLFFGLVLIKSLSGPARQLADVMATIASGSRTVLVPALGNLDDFGRIARLLDHWADTQLDVDRLKHELDRTRRRLDETLSEAEAEAVRAAEEARAQMRAEFEAQEAMRPKALLAPEVLPDIEPSSRRRYGALDAMRDGDGGEIGGGPISTVSQRLANFSQYVTAAAGDVERTEALIKGLDQLLALVEDIGGLVTTIRDQTNLLAFRGPAKDAPHGADDKLVAFTAEGRGGEAERVYAQRFDSLRDATERTERIVGRIRATLDVVVEIARGIAETASEQALEATNRLLSQSEYLQNMLDDILSKIHPAKPGSLSQRRVAKRGNEDPFA
ncbi:MAG: hypothetical protein O2944_01825 [Proteobacteria bacterium]|nr:hypothetical protein [Pseudomonadota bacterium]